MNNTEIWLERFHSLYKSQMRQAVSTHGMQLVHFEILQYLSICNDYSNTAQAVSEYLGQTKGSISQSLKTMEKLSYIKRQPSLEDKRVTKLSLTTTGEQCLQEIANSCGLHCTDDVALIESIKILLVEWQGGGDKQGFGQCLSCSYHRKLDNGDFQCGLTKASLSRHDIRKICREHLFEVQSA